MYFFQSTFLLFEGILVQDGKCVEILLISDLLRAFVSLYYCCCLWCMDWVGLPHTDPFFTDLSGLSLQSGVGVGPGRLVKDEYSVGGGSVASTAGVGVGPGMDVDGELNQTIQHHPPPQVPPPNNTQQTQQPFIPTLAAPTPG